MKVKELINGIDARTEVLEIHEQGKPLSDSISAWDICQIRKMPERNFDIRKEPEYKALADKYAEFEVADFWFYERYHKLYMEVKTE